MPHPTTLLDTREPFDATICGYDGPRDPHSSTEGLIMEFTPRTQVGQNFNPPCVTLYGPEGEVDIIGAECIREVYKSLTQVMAILARKVKPHVG